MSWPSGSKIHPEALAEASDARRFYLRRDVDLAIAFEELVDLALERIETTPRRWPEYIDGTRRYLIRRFPYSVIYDALPESARVLAIAHQRQWPGYWRARR